MLAITPDRPERLRETFEEHGYAYRLLSDDEMLAARAYGIAFRVDDASLARYRGFGVDLEERSGRDHHLLPVPSVFLVDRQGVIRFVYSNPDYKVRVDPRALLEAARAHAPPPAPAP